MIALTVNGSAVQLSRFPRTILEATYRAALGALKGGENFTAAELRVEGDRAVALAFAGTEAPLDEFVARYLGGLVAGTVGALRLPEDPTTYALRLA
jgi:hypothetical protein